MTEPNGKPILAVIVLYRMALADSPTWQALNCAFAAIPGLVNIIQILVADNSPQPGPLPPGFAGALLADGQNPGLALRYNQALAAAQAQGAHWLLLFDQDTQPTNGYFAELTTLAAALAHQPEVAIIVPRLIMDGRILSPFTPLYQSSSYKVDLQSRGVLGPRLHAFNSGALVRVSALQAIGGFPQHYPFDYLDHATFHQLQQAGGQVYVMTSTIEHELGESARQPHFNTTRIKSRYSAEARFYREFGSPHERNLYRLDLLRQVVGHARRGKVRQALIRLRALFF